MVPVATEFDGALRRHFFCPNFVILHIHRNGSPCTKEALEGPSTTHALTQ